MIKMPLDEIVAKIKEKSGLSEEEIRSRIEQKIKQLSGLVSKEGAAHIVANELGIKLFESISGRLQIKNILPGMRDVETVGRVIRLFPITEFSKDGRSGKVASMIIADQTGQVRIVLWNEQADNIARVSIGNIVKIVSGYVRERRDGIEIHLNQRSRLIVNPPDESLPEISETKQIKKRKYINELQDGDTSEVFGAIVQVFEPRFYEICPECGKRLKQIKEGLSCDIHGIVNPRYAYVINIFLDDGTENIRVVCFREQALQLLQKTDDEMLEFKNFPEKFESVKSELLGSQIKVFGRAVKKQGFDRIELIAQNVDVNPNPEEEIAMLKTELEKVNDNK